MGNDARRRLTNGREEGIRERRHWTDNAAARGARDAKRTVTRRERREGRDEARTRDD